MDFSTSTILLRSRPREKLVSNSNIGCYNSFYCLLYAYCLSNFQEGVLSSFSGNLLPIKITGLEIDRLRNLEELKTYWINSATLINFEGKFWMTTETKSEKIKQIMKNSKVELSFIFKKETKIAA